MFTLTEITFRKQALTFVTGRLKLHVPAWGHTTSRRRQTTIKSRGRLSQLGGLLAALWGPFSRSALMQNATISLGQRSFTFIDRYTWRILWPRELLSKFPLTVHATDVAHKWHFAYIANKYLVLSAWRSTLLWSWGKQSCLICHKLASFSKYLLTKAVV